MIRPQFDVWCDYGHGWDDQPCLQWIEGGATRAEAAKAALAHGWRRIERGMWVCPRHPKASKPHRAGSLR